MTRGALTGTAWALAAAVTLISSQFSARAATVGTPARDLPSRATPDAAMPQPGILQYNGDWAVGCDNLLRCEAIALEPEAGGSEDEPLLLQIIRDSGPAGAVTLRVSGLSQLPAQFALVIDGREAALLNGSAGDEALVAGDEALRTVQDMANAVTIEFRPVAPKKKRKKDAEDVVLASLSTAGLAETLRFIDVRQGRMSTQSALILRGTEPDTAIPAPPAVPQVPQVPSPDADAAPGLTAEEMTAARKLARCDPSLMSEGVSELFPLDGQAALLLFPCEAGAYNVSAVPLIARGAPGSRRLAIARFDFSPGFTGEPGKPPLVVNALWDARRGVLSSLAKGRGIGDCGASENYVWDGSTFRLIESRAMHVCRGAWEWIRLWEAEPKRVDVPAAPPQAQAAVGPG